MRKAFNFFNSYWQTANELNDKDRLAFYDAILHYQFTGDKSKLDSLTGLAKFAYISQAHSIDSQIRGYYDNCKKQKINPFEYPAVGGDAGACLPPALQEKEKEEEKEEVKEKEQEKAYRQFKHLRMTLSEFDKVVALGYTKQQIDNVLNSIRNYRKNTNYVDLYLTCLKWIRKEYPNVEKPEVKKSKGTIHDNHF